MRLALRRARAATDPNPTPAQIAAGNYAKGKLQLHGLTVTIENPIGSVRRSKPGVTPAWEKRFSCDYGYINRTEGSDGDHVDVFIGPHPESELVFVIDQVGPDGRFDEHKCMFGFGSRDEARAGYAAHYSPGWKVGPITALTVEQFKRWLVEGNTTKPIAKRVKLVLLRKAEGDIKGSGRNVLGIDARGHAHWRQLSGGAPTEHPRPLEGEPRPWPADFPTVIVHGEFPELVHGRKRLLGRRRGRAAYDAAKGGDAAAAYALAHDFADPRVLEQLATRFPGAAVVPVLAQEAAGRNKLPLAYATVLAEQAGFTRIDDIVQVNLTRHSGAGAEARLVRTPQFEGPVEPGRAYVVVDDVISSGSTLRALRLFLENHGGVVVAASTLAVRRAGALGDPLDLAPSAAVQTELATRFDGTKLDELLRSYGIARGAGELSNQEALYLLQFGSLDAVRDRLAQGRDEAVCPGDDRTRAPGESGEPGPGSGPLTKAARWILGLFRPAASAPTLEAPPRRRWLLFKSDGEIRNSGTNYLGFDRRGRPHWRRAGDDTKQLSLFAPRPTTPATPAAPPPPAAAAAPPPATVVIDNPPPGGWREEDRVPDRYRQQAAASTPTSPSPSPVPSAPSSSPAGAPPGRPAEFHQLGAPGAQPWGLSEHDYIAHAFEHALKRADRNRDGWQKAFDESPEPRPSTRVRLSLSKRDEARMNAAHWDKEAQRLRTEGPRPSEMQRWRDAYIEVVKKAISSGQPVPTVVIGQRPEFAKARDARDRYDKGRHTSFANESVAVDRTMQRERGYKVKRQDGKPITPAQVAEIAQGMDEIEEVLGPTVRDILRRIDLTIAHTSGKYPFLTAGAGGLHNAGDRTISIGVVVGPFVQRALAHELAHVLDFHAGRVLGAKTAVQRGKVRQSESLADSDHGRYDEFIRDARRRINDVTEVRRVQRIKTNADTPPEVRELVERQKVALGPYWNDPAEIFARLVEQYVTTARGKGGVASDGDYTRQPGWWTAEDFAHLAPMVAREIGRRIAILGGDPSQVTGQRQDLDAIAVSSGFASAAEARTVLMADVAAGNEHSAKEVARHERRLEQTDDMLRRYGDNAEHRERLEAQRRGSEDALALLRPGLQARDPRVPRLTPELRALLLNAGGERVTSLDAEPLAKAAVRPAVGRHRALLSQREELTRRLWSLAEEDMPAARGALMKAALGIRQRRLTAQLARLDAALGRIA